MIKQLLNICIVFVLLGVTACEEIPPVVNPIVNQGDCTAASDNLVVDQQRQVLIEEFTGVRCVNCPAGSALIEDLLDQHGKGLIAVSIHEGFFANPSQQSQYDFRTDDGNAIARFLGDIQGYPAAAVNRVRPDGSDELVLGSSQWAKIIEDELAVEPRVKLYIDHSYDTASRELSLEVSIFPQEDIEEDTRLSVFILEDGVEDYQLTPGGDEANYLHKHIFRDAVTNPEGNPIQEVLNPTTRVCKSYVTGLSADWNELNCSIVAFVHLGGSTKNILQAVKVEL